MRRKIRYLSTFCLAASVTVAATSGSAKAASVFGPGGTLLPNQTNVNQILYHNYENVFNPNGTLLAPGAPILPGDFVVGILNIDQISPPATTVGSTFGNGTTSINEITGVFAQKVLSITPGAGGPGSLGTTYAFGTLAPADYSMTFGTISPPICRMVRCSHSTLIAPMAPPQPTSSPLMAR